MPDSYYDENGKFIVDLGAGERAARANAGRKRLSEYGDIDLASGFKAKEIWTTQDGRRIAIPNLTDDHLLNILAYLRRRVPDYKRFIIAQFAKHSAQIVSVTNLFDTDDRWNDQADKVLKHNLKEGKKVFNMGEDEFLSKYVPKWGRLYQEAYKRKILIEVDKGKVDGKRSG